jgi:peptidoglycan/LPS O-acetylase OafA/YrhL
MKYRPDIDGLRALAVLSVVLFHAGFAWLPGGFVGVDVFFVISGYLITQILIDEVGTSRFSIARFYVRRARRILPALYFISFIVFFLGAIFLLPIEFVGLSKTILATNLFSSNFFFWKHDNYFDTSAELKPLLHTWSLAVEEQFYIFWPLFLAFSLRRGWRLHWLILLLIFFSFAFASLLLLKKPITVFYLPMFRAWELLIGAWLATEVLSNIEGKLWKNGCSLIGLGLLVLSALFLNKSLPFPGWNALPPCMSAVLIIAAGKDAVVNRYLLSARPLVFLGLISYSLYLWHWPLLAYIRVLNLGQLPLLYAAVAVILSIMLAALTWKYVEQPFRHGGQVNRPASLLFKFALPGGILCMMAGTAIAYKGFPSRISTEAMAAQEAAQDFNSARADCHLGMPAVVLPEVKKCTSQRLMGAANKIVAVWGDSHAEAMAPGVVVMPGLNEAVMLQLTKTSCPPLLGASVLRGGTEYRECEVFNDRVMELLKKRKDITTVVLAARWPVYALEAVFGVPEEVPGAAKYALKIRDSNVLTPISSMEVFGESLSKTIGLLVQAGKKVVVVGAVPEMKYNAPGCVARERMSLLSSMQCGLYQDKVVSRILGVNDVLGRAANQYQAIAVYPDSILCQKGYCAVEGPGGQIFYYDHNHLSTAGARYVFSRLSLKE